MSKSPDQKNEQTKIPGKLPVLPVRDLVVFPQMVLPLFVGRDLSVKAIEKAAAEKKLILLAAQKSLDIEVPKVEDIYTLGTVGTIMRMLRLSDGRIKILVQGISKARILSFSQTEPYFEAEIEVLEEPTLDQVSSEVEATVRAVKEQMEKAISFGKFLMPDVVALIENLEDPGRLADLVVSNLGLKVDLAQDVLETIDPVERLKKANDILSKELHVLIMQQKIQSEAKGEMDKVQREYFLREQLKAIQKELGETDDRSEEIEEFREKITAAKMLKKVEKEALKQLRRLERMHQDSAEAATVRTYLEWMVELPWSKQTKDRLDLVSAKKILDEDHYDLERIKERILEYLAVRKMKGKLKGPILCFVGPPGVGKTSLGKSIARSLGRKFIRISLGGVHDEAEIRGHRRTYVGALPGRLIQGMKQAGTANPVFMMDEIDKIGTDFRGDPSSALLEVLDPEQNHSFSDHYLGVPFNLSNVMFITTANQIDPIPLPLRDRMEMIELSGYTVEEKAGIAKNFLLPRQLEDHGTSAKDVSISDAGMEQIITQYTREAGVRNLEREIARVLRKIARKMAEGGKQKIRVIPSNLHQFLGIPKIVPEAEAESDSIGVATGLAWTPTGGDVLQIEATIMKGKGELILTGSLGKVMKESAQAALSYIRSQEKVLKIKAHIFAKNDIHIHVPAGAIPKDGPSAGITMATALTSALTGIPVRHDVAMTGEITLRGRVLPIGGLKEKILAAKRAGMTTIIFPKRNEKDLEEVPKHLQKGLKFIFAEQVETVFKHVFRKKKRPKKSASKKSPRKIIKRTQTKAKG
ncbi:ATP-dependent protease La Type I [hydrothermal vent metagenome]|uniref:ATP-dependent protease La Type I n=1 Tax=hydrothermal vent metagenome TaxID=652676 RepID=A0A3B1CIY4_9ZZZZ